MLESSSSCQKQDCVAKFLAAKKTYLLSLNCDKINTFTCTQWPKPVQSCLKFELFDSRERDTVLK